VLALLVCSSYSYSEEVYGTSPNAAAFGLNWVMTNVLPQQAGLTVNGVVYRYTAVKDPDTDMIVYVQNENAIDGGYIFRESDDWSGLPGNTITKQVPVGSIPIEFWGDGSIQVDGEGSVTDPLVVYNYRYDSCFRVTTDPACPDYVPPVDPIDVATEDPLDDEYVKEQLERKAVLDEEDEEDRKRRQKMSEEERGDRRLESILGAVNSSLLAVESLKKHTELMSLNYIPVNYLDSLPDPQKYGDAVVLKDSNLPENKKARRQSVSQQLLHQELVNLQYEK
jgi:hypothetical protein